jgi:hypothetical protein
MSGPGSAGSGTSNNIMKLRVGWYSPAKWNLLFTIGLAYQYLSGILLKLSWLR